MKKAISTAIAKVIAADADVKVEYDLPANPEIHFVGRPILALNPETNNLTAPSCLLRHGLVVGRFFFTLPSSLLESIIGRIGANAFGSEALELERTLSAICGDHASQAGLWNGRAFPYHLLRPPTAFRLSATAGSADLDINQEKLASALCEAEERSALFHRIARAYAGWLLTNRDFLTEHDSLFSKWSDMVQRWGLERLGLLQLKTGYLPGDNPTADPRWPEYRAAFEAFFTRWRLLGLAAPYLPTPLQPLMAGSFPVTIVPQVNRAAGAYCYPDIYPVLSRDELRGVMEDALHAHDQPDHLQKWLQLVARDNPAKRPFIKFSRLLELQHYWRILHNRHAAAVYRKAWILKEELAKFLHASGETVHRDLLWITKRLGKNWIQRGRDFPFGPFSPEQVANLRRRPK